MKLPPILCNVALKENVTKLTALMVNVVPTLTNAGIDSVVNDAKDAANTPVMVAKDVNVTVVADAHTGENAAPHVVNAGKDNVVNDASTGAKLPVTVAKLVAVNDVNAA